jgi:bifunctional UDP-N-acetylglucosamine pyrophosphorylase / glucosamine-1-phosphate N-acetyltransferase
MRSSLPKLLHPICGRPMIGWVVAAARGAGASKIVVVDAPAEPLRDSLPDDVISVVQRQPLGTGDALKAATRQWGADDSVLVVYGDVPLIGAQTLAALSQAHSSSGAGATMLTAVLDDPTGYGRVVRSVDGSVEKVVETKQPGDATDTEMLIREINTGIYAFAGGDLSAALEAIGNDNAQGEYYLPDVLPILTSRGHKVRAFELGDPMEMFNVNDRVQLAAATTEAQRRIAEALMLAGATIVDPASTVIEVGVSLAPDCRIEPGTALHGTLIDTEVGIGSKVIHSYTVGASIGDQVSVGPFAYLRPGATLHEGSKAGTFVEIKNSEVGARSKVPHLSYIGDATIGENSNLGASTITANYDGYVKHRTTIGSNVHTHVHATLVAPVEIADDAFAGAGSVITDDIPQGALGIARPRQTNIEGYADRVRERHESKHTDAPASTSESASAT